MKTNFIAFLISILILTSCMSTSYIKNEKRSYDALNVQLIGERCKIILADSGFVLAEDVVLTEDSTYIFKTLFSSGMWHSDMWLSDDTIITPTSNVRRITYTDNTLGALEGLGFGVAGSLIALALGPGVVESAAEEQDNPGNAIAAAFGASIAMGLMVIGAPIGGVIWGAIIGHKHDCVINDWESSADTEIEKVNMQELSEEDKSPFRVEFSSILEKGSGYLIILWQGKKIRLDRSEYSYRGTSADGQEYIFVPKYIYEQKFKYGIINDSGSVADNGGEKIELPQLSAEDESPVRVEFSSIIEKGSGYLVILWQGKKIHLDRSEYSYRGTGEHGQEFIVIPKYIYRLKFK